MVELDAERLRQMLPPEGVGMKHSPIPLWGACYAESVCHKIEWQIKKTVGCVGQARRRHRHQLRLLPKCLVCEKLFPFRLYGWTGNASDVKHPLQKWQNIKSLTK
ncbi:hypothetical protein [uncultured Nostoc sp.]|uniref:hypothetical protein n=1 Tax=uncultured Nostoc sp. TaxID=340711 RepID=UPI0035CC306D